MPVLSLLGSRDFLMPTETLERRQPQEPFNREHRLYFDTATWGAEVLDGQMRTTFEYGFDGYDLYAEDGSRMRGVFKKALEGAQELAEENPDLAFEKRRREIEMEEHEEMLDMAAGNGPNTLVVISEYPAELNGTTEDVGGYNHRRKQAMMRVISRTEEGGIRITSQSLDKSDRQGLESIYEFFGEKPEPDELLGQRIRADVEPYRHDLLADELTREYDRTLENKFGNQYHAGRTPAEKENTYDFVIRQQDLLQVFMMDPSEDNKYAFAAALDGRWNNDKTFSIPKALSNAAAAIELGMAQNEMIEQSVLAKEENKSFSGCGVTLNAGGLNGELGSLGYGNRIKGEYAWAGGKDKVKKGTCVNCKEAGEVGEESWCKSCISGHCG